MSTLPVAPRLDEAESHLSAEPVVLPFAPRIGWANADRARRRFAATGPALLVVWAMSVPITPSLEDPGPGLVWVLLSIIMTMLVVGAGPPACYSIARIVRPHPAGTGQERQARHWCAAIATAYGLAALTLFASGHGLELSFGAYLFVLAAATLGPITIVWGLIAAAQRAVVRVVRRRTESATQLPS